MDWLTQINPLTHVGASAYATFWQTLFATLFLGIWSRIFATLLLLLSFWFGVRRRNFMMGFWIFILSGSLAYGAAVMRFVGLLSR